MNILQNIYKFYLSEENKNNEKTIANYKCLYNTPVVVSAKIKT